MNRALQINCTNLWLRILLKQYFADIEFTDDAELFLVENEFSFTLKSPKQDLDIQKPINIMILVSAIEQIQYELKKTINIGEVTFYPGQRFMVCQGEEISLTQKETEILSYLYQHPGYIDKATLLEAIWGYSSDILTHTLETHIYKLRSKFAGKYDIIHSNETGYVLNLES